MIAALLNHLWQSTLFVGVAGLMALALTRNSATVRFWVWFAASFKFLVPFAALTALSAYALAPMVPPVAIPSVTLAEPLAKPFSAPAMARIATRWSAPSAPVAHPPLPALAVVLAVPAHVAPAAPEHAGRRALSAFHLNLESALLALWAAGVAMLALRWLMRWRRLRALLRDAVEAGIDAPIAVKFSASRLEPGLVGILDPVILLPRGIDRQLSQAELKAVLTHELGHWRRHDNLLAAIHMLVEALFWFFPLVWWVGARLNAEREHACDEGVLAAGNDPETYAEAILKICRVYLQSPLACVAGVSGANLGQRIRAIMENGLVLRLNAVRKCLLSATAATALALPVALGLLTAPVVQMQAKAAQILASIKTGPTNAADDRSDEALQTSGAPDGEAVPKHHPFRLTIRNLAVPAPDWSHLLSPVPADLFASNDPPSASAQLAQFASDSSSAAAPVNAAQPAAAATADQALAPGACQTPKLMASASLEAVPGSDLLTVPVAINGSPQKFLLDLDLRAAMVSPELVSKVSLPNALPNAVSMNGVAAQNAAIAIRSLDIGGVATGRASLAVTGDGQIPQSAAYDGILSGSFFQQYDAEINFAEKKIAWFTPTRCADPNQIASWAHGDLSIIPVTLAADGRLKLQATIRGHVVNAEIDTSSPRTILRRTVAEQTIGLKENSADMVPVSGLEDGRHMQVYASTFTQIAFAEGGIMVGNVPVLIQDFGMAHSITRTTDERIPDLTIGMDVLRHLHMYVALGQGRIYVTAAEPLSGAASAAPRLGQAALTSADMLKLQQATEAREFCMKRDQGPDNDQYGKCVNTYLQLHYDWEVIRLPGGRLVASTRRPQFSNSPAGSIGGSGINTSNNTAFYNPQALH
ncbi:MAG TPA: M56 family metallopeptidase [Rhizomicrobium sp.]|jgi:beta-lactamase regulating signal transducer with metallopeptidase domain|nr:M56 family metallopeptidase [Rhizomicrobium sp.]